MIHRHHVISQQQLRKLHATWRHKARLTGDPVPSLTKLLNDPRNEMRVTARRHYDHHHAPNRRLTRAEIPEDAETFAAELGLVWFLDRVYGELEAAA